MYHITRRYRVHRADGTISAYGYLARAIEDAKRSLGYVSERGRIIFSTTPERQLFDYID